MSSSAIELATLPSGLVVLMMLLGAAIVFATLAVGLPIAIIKGFQLVSAIAGWSRERARLGLGRVRRQPAQGELPVEPSAPWEGGAHMTSAEKRSPTHPMVSALEIAARSRSSRSRPPALRRLREPDPRQRHTGLRPR